MTVKMVYLLCLCLSCSSLYYNIDSIFKIYIYAFIFNSVLKLRHWPDILVELYLERLYCRMANNYWDTVIKRCLSRLVASKNIDAGKHQVPGVWKHKLPILPYFGNKCSGSAANQMALVSGFCFGVAALLIWVLKTYWSGSQTRGLTL